MKVTSRSVILAGAVLFLGTPAMAALTSSGLVGDCVDCHTMHNSEQGAPVALEGTSTTPSGNPIQNLLRMDCIACHANPNQTVAILDNGGGSRIPQVNHTSTTDLAGGNFAYLAQGNRKGHNVVELGYGNDDDGANWGAPGLEQFSTPPGMYSTGSHQTGARFTEGGGFLKQFTCAGSAGCHGIRNQAAGILNDNTTSGVNGNVSGENGADFYTMGTRLEGIAAISGAHHNSYDGVKEPVASDVQLASGADGKYIAASYRFIPGLMGAGNTTDDAYRWQNHSSTSHNEYFGTVGTQEVGENHCGDCHQDKGNSVGSHLSDQGFMKVPNQSISGFCATCHGSFHSPASATGTNGDSGAFLRHPNDYALPNSGEYSNYTTYDITAPVARASINGLDGTSSTVDASTGNEIVMCLSCHMAHASQYDGMLRFNYNLMEAGSQANMAAAQAAGGCYACHTTKGVLPGNR